MKTRALAVLAVAGLAAVAQAQDTTMTYSIVWDKASINPGETNTGKVVVEIKPGIGSTILWTTAPGKGQAGILKAFASSIFDTLSVLNGNQGTLAWTVPAALGVAGIPGTSNGAGGITGTNAGQVAPPLNPTPVLDNPITVLNISWTGNAGFSGDVNYGIKSSSGKMFLDISTGGNPIWVGHNATSRVDGQGGFTVVPAPASMALLGLGGLVAARRRR